MMSWHIFPCFCIVFLFSFSFLLIYDVKLIFLFFCCCVVHRHLRFIRSREKPVVQEPSTKSVVLCCIIPHHIRSKYNIGAVALELVWIIFFQEGRKVMCKTCQKFDRCGNLNFPPFWIWRITSQLQW